MKVTETYKLTETKLKRIAALSAAEPSMVFTNLIHLLLRPTLIATNNL